MAPVTTDAVMCGLNCGLARGTDEDSQWLNPRAAAVRARTFTYADPLPQWMVFLARYDCIRPTWRCVTENHVKMLRQDNWNQSSSSLLIYSHICGRLFFSHGLQHTLRTWSKRADRGCTLAV